MSWICRCSSSMSAAPRWRTCSCSAPAAACANREAHIMYLRMFINQYLMGLKLHSRVPSAIFWLFAFPTVMLLGLGTVFGGAGNEGPTLVWSHSTDAGPDDFLKQALADRHVKLEILSP